MASNIGDLTGRTLGTCMLERLLGQGGMGAVYLAQQTRPSRHVAVKVLLPNLSMNSAVYQEFLARFRREADVIARLEHVNIMPIYEYGEQDGLAYLVMPHLTGGSLRDVLSRRGVLPLPEVAQYIEQAASALDYAHAQGVIHRDLKPANFLLASDGRLVLADFGIARIMEESNASGSTLTGTGMLLGTPEYMAPEMARGEPVDYRADIYELGVVLYQMISGHVPFSGGTPYAVVAKHVQETLPLLYKANPAIPPAVDAVIQKATAKSREERYATAREMAQALRSAISDPRAPSAFQQFDQGGMSTIAAGDRPMVLPAPSPSAQYNTPPNQMSYPQNVPMNTEWSRTNAGSSMYAQPSYPGPQTPPYTGGPPMEQFPDHRRHNKLAVVLVVLLACVLIVGGIIIGLQLSRGASSNHPSPTTTTGVTATTASTAPSNGGATATSVPSGATGAATPTTAPAPTTAPSSTASNTNGNASAPAGKQLYATNLPGQNCDTGGGTWLDYNNVKVDCLGSKVRIRNMSPTPALQGTFLTGLPGQPYPNDYVVQATVQATALSANDFGIYFRNQSGQQQGAYSFLVHPDGTWNAYVYDNNSGAATKLTGGNLGNAHATLTLAVVVKGQHFSFYANGNMLGSADNGQYTSGTAGIAVDQKAALTVSNFSLYATQ